MIPVYRIFSIFMKKLAKPVIYKTKNLYLQGSFSNQLIRTSMEKFGNYTYNYNIKINKLFMKLEYNETDLKILNSQQAIRQGAQYSCQIFIYVLIIGLSIIQLLISYYEKRSKELEMLQRIRNIQMIIQKRMITLKLIQKASSEKKLILFDKLTKKYYLVNPKIFKKYQLKKKQITSIQYCFK